MNAIKSTDYMMLTDGYERYLGSKRPFTDYMLDIIRNKGLIRQRIFEKAGVSTGYGYKILYGEKTTLNRDLILSICISAELELKQIQTALLLYHMPLLFPCYPRDSILISSIIHHADFRTINERLVENNCAELTTKTSSM